MEIWACTSPAVHLAGTCHGLTLAGSETPPSHSLILLQWDGGRESKVRKLVGADKDSLISKEKAAHASKAEQAIHPLRPIFSKAGFHPRTMVTWEDKCHHFRCPLSFLLFTPVFIAGA